MQQSYSANIKCNVLFHFASDIDECRSPTENTCSEVADAACNNTDGGYTCVCEDGYMGNGYVSCEGIII